MRLKLIVIIIHCTIVSSISAQDSIIVTESCMGGKSTYVITPVQIYKTTYDEFFSEYVTKNYPLTNHQQKWFTKQVIELNSYDSIVIGEKSRISCPCYTNIKTINNGKDKWVGRFEGNFPNEFVELIELTRNMK